MTDTPPPPDNVSAAGSDSDFQTETELNHPSEPRFEPWDILDPQELPGIPPANQAPSGSSGPKDVLSRRDAWTDDQLVPPDSRTAPSAAHRSTGHHPLAPPTGPTPAAPPSPLAGSFGEPVADTVQPREPFHHCDQPDRYYREYTESPTISGWTHPAQGLPVKETEFDDATRPLERPNPYTPPHQARGYSKVAPVFPAENTDGFEHEYLPTGYSRTTQNDPRIPSKAVDQGRMPDGSGRSMGRDANSFRPVEPPKSPDENSVLPHSHTLPDMDTAHPLIPEVEDENFQSGPEDVMADTVPSNPESEISKLRTRCSKAESEISKLRTQCSQAERMVSYLRTRCKNLEEMHEIMKRGSIAQSGLIATLSEDNNLWAKRENHMLGVINHFATGHGERLARQDIATLESKFLQRRQTA